MKILVLSDTHGVLNPAMRLIEQIQPDRVIHLGDFCRDAIDLENIFDRIPFDYVAGNCDYSDHYCLRDKIVQIMDKKIWITHGHLYQVKKNMDALVMLSKQKKVDAVLYGHTHKQVIAFEQKVAIMNPGSLTLPKDGHGGGYGILEIDDQETIHLTTNRLKYR